MALEQKEEAINQLKAVAEQLFDKVGGAQVHNHNTTNYTYNIILNAVQKTRPTLMVNC